LLSGELSKPDTATALDVRLLATDVLLLFSVVELLVTAVRKQGELWRLELLRTAAGGGGAGGIRLCKDCCLLQFTDIEQLSICLIVLRSCLSAIGSDRTAIGLWSNCC